MTTVSLALPTDMMTYNLFGIADSDVTSYSTTKVVAFDSDDDETFTFTGDFANFDPGTHVPASGTITGFVLVDGGVQSVTLSNFSLSVQTFLTYLNANDINGVNTTMLAGNDSIEGGQGGDSLYGYAGDDTISEAHGANYLRGNEGDDSIQGGDGFDDINGNQGGDTIDGGAGGHDWLVGGQGDDLLIGHQSDILWGNLGNDTIHGGTILAQLRGGQGDDVIVGGSGNEYISGDRGADTETGGAGADTFHSSSGVGTDLVLDFNQAEGDRVMLDPGTAYTVSQVGGDTVVDMGNGDKLVLQGVALSSLKDGWIFEGTSI